jgi:hypothetical protein
VSLSHLLQRASAIIPVCLPVLRPPARNTRKGSSFLMSSSGSNTRHMRSKKNQLALALVCTLSFLGLCYVSVRGSTSRVALSTGVSLDAPSPPRRSNHRTLGIASHIYVISLPRRQDRRNAFDVFRVALGLAWTYVDATDASDPAIAGIMANVRAQRVDQALLTEVSFRWPEDIDAVASSPSSAAIGSAESDLWALSAPPSHAVPAANGLIANGPPPVPLTCAYDDATIPPYTPDLPDYKILTASEVACWHSHLGVIRVVADSPEHSASVVLEDDVDMERDIHERLEAVWDAVPAGWDIVFLGASPFPWQDRN